MNTYCISVITDTSESEVGVYVMLDGKTQQITHQTGTIVSHRGYSHENYPNNVDSTLRLEIDGILLIRIAVTDFELESRLKQSGSCIDYLEIEGQKYCGVELASNTTYESATGALNMKFHTDSQSRDKGFLFEYRYYSHGEF